MSPDVLRRGVMEFGGKEMKEKRGRFEEKKKNEEGNGRLTCKLGFDQSDILLNGDVMCWWFSMVFHGQLDPNRQQ